MAQNGQLLSLLFSATEVGWKFKEKVLQIPNSLSEECVFFPQRDGVWQREASLISRGWRLGKSNWPRAVKCHLSQGGKKWSVRKKMVSWHFLTAIGSQHDISSLRYRISHHFSSSYRRCSTLFSKVGKVSRKLLSCQGSRGFKHWKPAHMTSLLLSVFS